MWDMVDMANMVVGIHHAALWLCVNNSSSSLDKETPRDTQALSNFKCQPPGMLRRTRHLRICQSEAPASLAAAAIPGHRSEEKMSMAKHRDMMSPSSSPSVPLSEKMVLPCSAMAKTPPPPSRKQYRARLAARMKAARAKKGYSQADMANILGLTLEAYKKCEQRGALWADMIEPFAYAVGEDALFVLTGRREKTINHAPETPLPIPVRSHKLRA